MARYNLTEQATLKYKISRKKKRYTISILEDGIEIKSIKRSGFKKGTDKIKLRYEKIYFCKCDIYTTTKWYVTGFIISIIGIIYSLFILPFGFINIIFGLLIILICIKLRKQNTISIDFYNVKRRIIYTLELDISKDSRKIKNIAEDIDTIVKKWSRTHYITDDGNYKRNRR